MARRLTVTRLKETRAGWSYRAHDFELKLNGDLLGTVKDGESVSFHVPEDELFLETGPRTPSSHRPVWRAVIPAGKDDYSVTVSPWEHREPIVEQK